MMNTGLFMPHSQFLSHIRVALENDGFCPWRMTENDAREIEAVWDRDAQKSGRVNRYAIRECKGGWETYIKGVTS